MSGQQHIKLEAGGIVPDIVSTDPSTVDLGHAPWPRCPAEGRRMRHLRSCYADQNFPSCYTDQRSPKRLPILDSSETDDHSRWMWDVQDVLLRISDVLAQGSHGSNANAPAPDDDVDNWDPDYDSPEPAPGEQRASEPSGKMDDTSKTDDRTCP
eukprot:261244-Pyramimonas_sp.AAC.1